MRSYYWKLPDETTSEPPEVIHGKLSLARIDHKLKNGEILFARKFDRDKAVELLKSE